MELLVKVANQKPHGHRAFNTCWRDGQIVTPAPDGHKWGKMERMNFSIIRVNGDYNKCLNDEDWKKFWFASDSNGRYPWENFYLQDEKRIRVRDWFVDYEDLVKKNLITKELRQDIYEHGKFTEVIDLSSLVSIDQLLKSEVNDSRLVDRIKNQGITSGTYSIGSGLDYSTINAFVTDTNSGSQMTGAITGEHADEETAIASISTLDVDTNGYLWKVTAASGAKHRGDYKGARVTVSNYCYLALDETTAGDIADVEVSDLAWDIDGTGAAAVVGLDCGGSGTITVKNNFMDANGAAATYGVSMASAVSADIDIYNNVIQNIGGSSFQVGIKFHTQYTSNTVNICNNTICKCRYGIRQDGASSNSATLTIKNNLLQGSVTASFLDDGAGFGTTAKNITEDGNGPDASYDNTDVHTNSVFNGYSDNMFLLDEDGDSTNLAIVDDGDDLSGTFTTDILGNTRSTWYIGAHEPSSTFVRKCSIALQASKIPSNQTDFPVVLNEDCFPSEMLDLDGSYGLQKDGGDLRFYSDSDLTTQLPIEVAYISLNNTPANSKIEVHVKISSLSSGGTTIYAKYNNPNAVIRGRSHTYGSENVWNSSYEGIYHLTEDGTDSTSNEYDLDSTLGAPAYTDGLFGRAVDMDGNDALYIDDPDTNAPNLIGDGEDMTWECLTYHSSSASADDRVVMGNHDRVVMGVNSSGNWGWRPYRLSGNAWPIDSGDAFSDDTWYYMVMKIDLSGATNYAYFEVDNTEVANESDTSNLDYRPDQQWGIGAKFNDNTDYWYGCVDEVRVTNDAMRSDDWITTSYNNLTSAATFAIEGTPENVEDAGVYGYYYMRNQ